ncbi:MAG: hypothetical protein LBV47_06145 [Bacteroidales bacterium]|jgi:hypothetical protein|nr:hypothetical protein [Bacteroidales bacterium]
MKKNIFFKLLFLSTFVLSLSIGFVGCKNYDDDIEAIEVRLDQLEKLIPKDGAVVTSVTGSNGTLTVTYSNGDTKTVPITGTPGGPVSMGADGYWYSDGVKTNYQIVAGNPRVSTDGYLEFATTGSDGAVVWTKSEIYATGGYIVDAGGNYELWMAKKGSTTLEKFILPKSGGGLAKLDILGWIEGKGAGSENISRTGDLKNSDGDTFTVNFHRVADFKVDVNNSGTVSAMTGDPLESWSAMTDVVKTQVLNTLGTKGAERKGFLVQVHPAGIDISKMNFIVENSKGEQLPILVGTPELVTGLFTKAAASSALYFVPTGYTADKYATPAAYTDLFNVLDEPLYTLVETNSNTRSSEYTHWTVDYREVVSKEARVNALSTTATNDTDIAVIVGTSSKIKTGIPYSLKFDQTDGIDLGATPVTAAYVLDYYVAPNSDFNTEMFTISVDKKAGTFTVNAMPDAITLADFDLNVYKLGVDGNIYWEVINILPVRSNLSSVMAIGNYTIQDEDTRTGALVTSTAVNVPMTPMFDALAQQAIGGSNMRSRWQDAQRGAKTWSIVSVSVGGTALEGTELGAFKTNVGANAIAFKDQNGVAVTIAGNDMYKARTVVFTPEYSYGANLPVFELNKEYILGIEFSDADGNYLNTANVSFTPVIPPLSEMFQKEAAYWNGNVLNAYYKTPNTWAAGAFYNVTGHENSTFFNVYNGTPSLNNHSGTTPYDGGFTRFGVSTNSKRWINSVELALKDFNTQKVPGTDVLANTKVTVPVTGGILGTEVAGTPSFTSSVVELVNQYGGSKANDAYGKELAMIVGVDKYLNVYDYTQAEKDALDFNMKIMSALFEGRIEGTSTTGNVEAASVGSNVWSITDADIKGYNYTNSGAYSLFRVDKINGAGGVVYDYAYIDKVEFFVPNDVTVYQITGYDTAIGTVIENGVTYFTAIEPVLTGSANTTVKSVLSITAQNITNTTTTKIGVRVTDRFGKVKSVEVPLTIVVGSGS